MKENEAQHTKHGKQQSSAKEKFIAINTFLKPSNQQSNFMKLRELAKEE